MQVSLTRKLAEGMGIKPGAADPAKPENPLLEWSANWVTVWDKRSGDDLLVLVNKATHFAAAAYPVKRNALGKGIGQLMQQAIRNTLLSHNMGKEAVEAYMAACGEIDFTSNTDRKLTAWVNSAGSQCADAVKHTYGRTSKAFDDTIGAGVNMIPFKSTDYKMPRELMFDEIAKLTGKPAYDYRAFEILVTLDLEIYEATRRLIVPANITFPELHEVLQDVFDWADCHLHDFIVLGEDPEEAVATIVDNEEALDFAENGVLEEGITLSEYFPKYSQIIYTYDLGDNWEHVIELVRTIENHDAESPYLLEAAGQTPPEDVGGVGGFIEFREIILDPENEDYSEMVEWAEGWRPELSEYKSKPHLIRT